jgi:hypothetical protein
MDLEMHESAQLPLGHKPFYPLHEMAILLALRVGREGESMRTTIDKVRKRLLYAVGKGDLQTMGLANEYQLFYAAQTFAWARKKWPESFDDIPIKQDAVASDSLGVTDKVKTWVYPGTVDACHELLREAYDEIEILQAELASAELENARLQPLAERYIENREKNRRSARKPRKDA